MLAFGMTSISFITLSEVEHKWNPYMAVSAPRGDWDHCIFGAGRQAGTGPGLLWPWDLGGHPTVPHVLG